MPPAGPGARVRRRRSAGPGGANRNAGLTVRRAGKYLAPYLFRVARANHRLVQVADDQVTWRYRTSATGQTRRGP